jgi:hypothetical protein
MIPLPPRLDRFRYVAQNMREADRIECFAMMPADNTDAIAAHMEGLRISVVIGADDGTPVAAAGAIEIWPCVWRVGLIATDRWSEVVIGTTRWVRRGMLPTLVGHGAHRVDCLVWLGNEPAWRWLEMLGATREAVHRAYGKNREDFASYVWFPEPVNERSNANGAPAIGGLAGGADRGE